MSADNWAACPRCIKRSPDGMVDRPLFREDYEIYGAEDGAVIVSYSGVCEECNLRLQFETTTPIPGVED